MSKYTTEVRFICENNAGLVDSEGYNSINQILNDCVGNVFNFYFPIFDENYRKVLEIKILKHYYTREIATETVGLWKHFLDMRLNEIMPYYNKLYQSELLEFNPFYDVDLTKDHNSTGKSDTEHERSDSESQSNTRTDNLKSTSQDSGTQGDSGSDVAKNKRWDIYSDTPQGSLQNVENETYLTNARKIIDDGTGSTHSNTTTFGKKVVVDDTGTQQNSGSKSFSSEFTTGINTTEEYLEHVKGKTPGASYSKLLQEYRDTFLNIDMQIIEDLSDLFFGLW
jgi:hypothetical protein